MTSSTPPRHQRGNHTVTIYTNSNGGSSQGGSGTGGSGTGGAASVHGSHGDGSDDDPIDSLTYQLFALSKRVDQLSSQPATPSHGLTTESGEWNTMSVRPYYLPTRETGACIKFSKEFKSPPTVLVSLSGADVSCMTNFRVKVFATHVNAQGFTVHAETWSNTTLFSCGVSWLALGER